MLLCLPSSQSAPLGPDSKPAIFQPQRARLRAAVSCWNAVFEREIALAQQMVFHAPGGSLMDSKSLRVVGQINVKMQTIGGRGILPPTAGSGLPQLTPHKNMGRPLSFPNCLEMGGPTAIGRPRPTATAGGGGSAGHSGHFIEFGHKSEKNIRCLRRWVGHFRPILDDPWRGGSRGKNQPVSPKTPVSHPLGGGGVDPPEAMVRPRQPLCESVPSGTFV